MKVLSIRQPWAHLIVNGVKRIENRTWTTTYRGPLLIHAGARWADTPIADIERLFDLTIPAELPRGAIVGAADLVDVVTSSRDRFFSGPYGFVLENAQASPEPCPMKGRLGLFEIPTNTTDALHQG
jgi:hypothetical protein